LTEPSRAVNIKADAKECGGIAAAVSRCRGRRISMPAGIPLLDSERTA